MDKEQQHMIPSGYLSAWADPNCPPGNLGKVWVVQKADRSKKRKSPKNYFWEKDRYTLNDQGGVRNLTVENLLGYIETGFGEVAKHLKARTPLTKRDREILAHFSAAMIVRTDNMVGMMKDTFQTLQSQAARIESEENIEPSLSEALRVRLPDVAGTSVAVGIKEYAKPLMLMNLSILVTDDEAGFVTGDDPCSICVPGGRTSALLNEQVEVALPLAPQHLAFYSWRMAPRMYLALYSDQVERANARTLDYCKKEFVSWKGIVREEWFLPDAITPQS